MVKSSHLRKKFMNSKYLLLLIAPCFIYFLVFAYLPMWGVLVAFEKYSFVKGIFHSPWVGFKYFEMFFSMPYSFKIIGNTFFLSLYSLLWGFPIPIIFALVLNEIRTMPSFGKVVQTVSYMPHFISIVVVAGMIKMFLTPDSGFISVMLHNLGIYGMTSSDMLSDPKYFRSIYIISGIWQNMGWSSILFISAIANINPLLYEAAIIDGANRLKRVFYITIPCIAPTIITLLLLSIGDLLNIGFEKVFLLQNPATYSTSDVIATFVYRQGLLNNNFSYASAVGLLNSVVNLIFLIFANYASKRFSKISLW